MRLTITLIKIQVPYSVPTRYQRNYSIHLLPSFSSKPLQQCIIQPTLRARNQFSFVPLTEAAAESLCVTKKQLEKLPQETCKHDTAGCAKDKFKLCNHCSKQTLNSRRPLWPNWSSHCPDSADHCACGPSDCQDHVTYPGTQPTSAPPGHWMRH